MAPGTSGSDEPELMLDINTTPLIDVLLVLLVMLIITIPVQLHAVNMALPAASSVPAVATPNRVVIDIDPSSQILWQGVVVSLAELDRRMAVAAQMADQPEIHVRPDRNCSYAVFAHVLAASKRQGLNQVAVLGTEQFK